MDLRFGIFVVIFLIAAFIWQSNGKDSGNNDSSKKKNATKIQLSEDIAMNPFLQQSISSILPGIKGNPFLSTHSNNSQKPLSTTAVPNISLPQESNVSSTAIFTNNLFLNVGTDTRVETGSTDVPEPVTQAPVPMTNTPSPYAPASDNPFSTFYSHNPPIKTKFPPLDIPSFSDIFTTHDSTKTISERKCDEYVKEIAGTTEIMSLAGTSSVIKLNNVCRDTNRLVIGGSDATIGEFPHMVALGRRSFDEFTLMCGGTLISYTWVLSAAHCTYGPNGSPTDARVGFLSLSDQQSTGVSVAIKHMIRHPDYKAPAMYADIALVELMDAVTFSTFIRPACLYQRFDTVPASAWVSGWGITELIGDQTDILQKAKLDLIDNLECAIRYNSSKEVPHGITPSMICAGDPRGDWTKDSCRGDSGGPLQVIHPKNLCVFQVIGITSFGEGCAVRDKPGVYTRVSHYISWVESIVWPQ